MGAIEEYIDLTNRETNLENFSIQADGFNCRLHDSDDNQYKGFLLAKSEKGEAFTICNVDFQGSGGDRKYPPRITFKRTDANLQAKKVRLDQEFATIAFESGKD